MAETYDKGSTILIEVTFKRKTAFSTTLTLFDPTGPKITITDRIGTAKVDEAALTQSSTGKYYYICQTATTWSDGGYSSVITATDGSYTEREVNDEAFILE